MLQGAISEWNHSKIGCMARLRGRRDWRCRRGGLTPSGCFRCVTRGPMRSRVGVKALRQAKPIVWDDEQPVAALVKEVRGRSV